MEGKFSKFHKRITFYENSCDITKSISSYLNSDDVKAKMDAQGPYIFKDLSSQDQLVLIKLQYEGKITALEETIRQKDKVIASLKDNNSNGK